jgi:hypothetical protein
LSVVTFGCLWQNSARNGRLATVTMDERDLGRRTAMLLEEMRAGERPLDNEESVLIPVALTPGRTLGPAPAELRTVRQNNVK